MFNQEKEEDKKLDWMYKGPNSTVSREEYLLGRPVDKTLEQLNEEERQKQSLLPQPKNRVEHECIPPSIRDFNKLVQAEQVDLSTKLQEDPLVAIKKREEETRRQFLQNPVQLKKLQKALKAQQIKKRKKKKKSKTGSDSDSDLDKKLTEKLLGKNKKVSKEERNLDIILMHKYEALKDKLTESDLQDILNGKVTSSDESSEDEKLQRMSKKRQSSDSEEDRRHKHRKNKRKEDKKDKRRNTEHERRRHRSSSSSESEDESKNKRKNYDSDDSDSEKYKKRNYGLVTSDGKKIPLSRSSNSERKVEKPKPKPSPPPVQKRKIKNLTEEEKEKLRNEMMADAAKRDKERERNLRKYREDEEKERKQLEFNPDFIHKQLLKSTNTSSVESRIKSNLNNIQRSKGAMDKHFSRR